MSTLFDPRYCPICGEPNACAMANAAPNTEPQNAPPCWCVGFDFSDNLLDQVPTEAQRKACICQRCVQGQS
ncbi:cysteine-rich CWC family protein [Comamonadaceae bacterium M7527]|nr:cysteine-rich CWC family protein [Comamonadaceae bacterium M7527]